MDHVEGRFADQTAQQRGHLVHLVAGDDDGQTGEQTLDAGLHVARHGTPNGHRMYRGRDAAQMIHEFRPVVSADEGNQGDIMLRGQMAQHVIRPHLGAGVEGIGENLGEEEDACHGQIIRHPRRPGN